MAGAMSSVEFNLRTLGVVFSYSFIVGIGFTLGAAIIGKVFK